MNIITTILIGISLSMDAFSLALSIGVLGLTYRKMIMLALVVGIFHFFMPMLGSYLGRIFLSGVNNAKLLSSVIFFYIGMEMIKEFGKKADNIYGFTGMLIFALGVSLDSFGVGFTINDRVIISALIFSILSFLFTLVGEIFGKLISDAIGLYASVIGIIIMFVLAISSFVNFCSFN